MRKDRHAGAFNNTGEAFWVVQDGHFHCRSHRYKGLSPIEGSHLFHHGKWAGEKEGQSFSTIC